MLLLLQRAAAPPSGWRRQAVRGQDGRGAPNRVAFRRARQGGGCRDLRAAGLGWFFGGGEEPRQGVWIVEEDQYTILKKKVSRVYAAPPEERKKRIYSTAPSKFTTIDQASFQPKTHLLSPIIFM